MSRKEECGDGICKGSGAHRGGSEMCGISGGRGCSGDCSDNKVITYTVKTCIGPDHGSDPQFCDDTAQIRDEERHTANCLICGAPLVYRTEAVEIECSICGSRELSQVSCENGHFVCDSCHSRKAVERLIGWCETVRSDDPVEILADMMTDPDVYMQGPEHHVLAGAALLTAYRNAGGDIDLHRALAEMINRGSTVPGGACGFWGCCGAAVSAGIFMSIITETTPLSSDTWGALQQVHFTYTGDAWRTRRPALLQTDMLHSPERDCGFCVR